MWTSSGLRQLRSPALWPKSPLSLLTRCPSSSGTTEHHPPATCQWTSMSNDVWVVSRVCQTSRYVSCGVRRSCSVKPTSSWFAVTLPRIWYKYQCSYCFVILVLENTWHNSAHTICSNPKFGDCSRHGPDTSWLNCCPAASGRGEVQWATLMMAQKEFSMEGISFRSFDHQGKTMHAAREALKRDMYASRPTAPPASWLNSVRIFPSKWCSNWSHWKACRSRDCQNYQKERAHRYEHDHSSRACNHCRNQVDDTRV